MSLNAVGPEKRSVVELFSKALLKQKSEGKESKEKKTVLVGKHSMPARFIRRFSDSSFNNENADGVNRYSNFTKKQSPSSVDGISDVEEESEVEESDIGTIYTNQDSDEFMAIPKTARESTTSTELLTPRTPRKKLARLDTLNSKSHSSLTKAKIIREMVSEIDLRVKTRVAPPGYLVKLDELSPELLSWNKLSKNESMSKITKPNKKIFSNVRKRPSYKSRGNDNDTQDDDSERDTEQERVHRRHSIAGADTLTELPPPILPTPLRTSKNGTNRRLSLPQGSFLLPQLLPSDPGPMPLPSPDSAFHPLSTNSPPKQRCPPPEAPIVPSLSSPTNINALIPPISFSPERQNRRRVSVDIIGCNHPVELILAKADERCRRQSQVIATRDNVIAMQEAAFAVSNHLRSTFRERKLAGIEAAERRIFWAKMIAVVNSSSIFNSKMTEIVTASRVLNVRTNASKFIKQWYIQQKQRIHDKQNVHLKSSFRPFRRILKAYVIQRRINVAADRIKNFFHSCSTCTTLGFSASYVKQFTAAAKSIQRCIRSFLQCKMARIQGVLKIWDTLEPPYIKILLENRKKTDEGTDKIFCGSRGSSIKVITGPERRNRIQALKWIALKEKFRVFDNKFGNHFQKRMDADTRKNCFLPLALKSEIAAKIIKETRSKLLIIIAEANYEREIIVQSVVRFSLDDAALLIKGSNSTESQSIEGENTENIHLDKNFNRTFNRTITLSEVLNYKMIELEEDITRSMFKRSKKKVKKTVGERVPFNLFGHLLANDTVYESLIEAHDERETAVKAQQREMHLAKT